MTGPEDSPVDLLVEGSRVLTMDRQRTVVRDGAVAVSGGRIAAVRRRAELVERWPRAARIGGREHVVVPGFVNAHQHLTGDRLARSSIPDSIPSQSAIFDWAVPLHAAHTDGDDELSATAALVDAAMRGITFTVEAGTVAHPERVLAAYERVGVGGTLGTWGSDTPGLPLAGDVADVIDRQRRVIEMTAGHADVHGWVTLVGHDLMSDDLVVAASRLAIDAGTGLTFHLSPTPADADAYIGRTGARPLVHLDGLGALGSHVLVAHAVHVDDDEIDAIARSGTAVACCPWAYLRLAQGITTAGRHAELIERGARVAVGCDAENAGDRVDVLAATALAVGLWRDRSADVTRFGAHTALELATIAGAAAVGLDAELGSLEPGKRADVVVIDTSSPVWSPPGDPVQSLVWGPGATTVSDVVCGGRVVVRDGRCVTVDTDALRRDVQQASEQLLERAGIGPVSRPGP